jgi:uncharacterized protein
MQAIFEGRSTAGDYVDLVAERDVICIVSNCAQVNFLAIRAFF